MTKINQDYSIKNIKAENLVLTYNVSNNKFFLLDNNKTILNDNYIKKFQFEPISKNNYYLSFKHNNKIKKKEIILIFSSNKLDNPLFFNIYIKNNKNTFDILKSNCNSYICYTHQIIKENVSTTKFKKNGSYIFNLTYFNLQPCRISIKNKDYNVLGFTKTANINTTNKTPSKNIMCNVDRNLQNSWKVKRNKQCNYINFSNNKYHAKLKKCAIDNKMKTLLSNIPSIPQVFKQYVKNTTLMSAGDTKEKTEKAKNNILKKFGDEETQLETEKLEKTLGPEYKEVLDKSIQDFDKTDKKNYTKGNYLTLLKDIKEKSKEYKLIGKYKKCNGNKLTNVCNIENVVECQKKCNEIYDCAHISYDRKNKKCKLFNTCNLTSSYNNDSYSKKSLLRNNGYNLINAVLSYKNLPIPELPWGIRFGTFICGIIIILCSSMILYKIIKAIIKLFLCIYYDTCYSPIELLNVFSDKGPEKKYI
jgi:hypothetical protein